ncbi:hypothetical protein [Streptomyces vastus]|uniref:Uncharacterized protein n=1 Tax=Streptomyces vastus TaxID=285451 RepID=A0ABN3QPQ0_9ACTN
MSTDDDRAAQPREREEAAPPQEHEHDHVHVYVHEQERERESAKTGARPPPDAEPGSPPVRTPPLPVRRPLPRRDAAPVGPALPPALFSMLSAEELAAEAPSAETLRRVRRALRDIPDIG